VKIGPAAPEIIFLQAIIKKKKEINASTQIYRPSPVCNLAERAKKLVSVSVSGVSETV